MPGIIDKTAFLLRVLKSHKDPIKQLFDNPRSGTGDGLNILRTHTHSHFLQDSIVESIPVEDFFLGGVRGWIVVEFYCFGTVMMYQLCHHHTVGKISADVFLLPRKRNTVDHLIDCL